MIQIGNDVLTVKIDTHGAQLRSVLKNGKEMLWQGDKDWWEDTAPVLFPICSNLKNGCYKYEDKEYKMGSHGFSKLIDFEVENKTDESVTLTARADEFTLKQYPFDFVFSVTFTVCDNKLITDYKTYNPSDKDMYFSVGSHEGYDCPEGVENYQVEFNKTETFASCVLDGPILTYNKDKLVPDAKVIELKNEYFEVDAIILENINSDEIALVNKTTGEKIKVELGQFPNLLIWSIPGARFVCLEAWHGFPDFVDTDGDFTKKHSIIKLCPKQTDIKTHTIHF